MVLDFLKEKLKSKMTLLVIAIILLALIVEIFVFVCDFSLENKGTQTIVTDNPQYTPISVDCVFDGKKYVVTGADPQVIYTGISQKTRYVVLELENVSGLYFGVTLYYETPTSGFSEDTAVTEQITPFKTRAVFKISEDELRSVRFDIDKNVEISSITLMDAKAVSGLHIVDSFSFARFIIMCIAFALVVVLAYGWYVRRGKENTLNPVELGFVLVCFVFYTIWNLTQFINYAPDEMMRLDVTFFLFEHNRLPVGDELTHLIWGFSYAHMPTMLCNVIGYLFMCLASPFTAETLNLVFAARMVSVLAGTGTVYFVIKAAKLLFDSPSKWMMIVFAAFIPQFAFLASYVNNDSLAVFGSAMIFYVWVYVIKNKWTYGISALLVIGMSVCALSYYNSYGWILASIVFFVITYFKQNPKKYLDFIKLGGFIAAFTVVLISYLFVRHLVLYGDILGMSTGAYYGELYAQPGMKPSERFSLSEQGVGLMDMLFGNSYAWVASTVKSFFAAFGYMQYFAPEDMYTFYYIVFGAGVIGFIALLTFKIMKRQKIQFDIMLLYALAAGVAMITVFLSIYNSYFNDFQAQGRYCYPALIPVVLIVSRGLDYLVNLFKKESYRYFAVGTICSTFIVVSLLVFKIVFVQSCI